jgi:hypothetical protein
MLPLWLRGSQSTAPMTALGSEPCEHFDRTGNREPGDQIPEPAHEGHHEHGRDEASKEA